MANFTTAAEAVRLIKSHDNVYIQGSTSIPEVLVQAMTDRADELTGVGIYTGFAVADRPAPYADPKYRDTFIPNSFFIANNIRQYIHEGYAQLIPALLGQIPGMFRRGLVKLDVALLNVSEPDENGYCSYGISADLAVSAVETAKIRIAQVNSSIPYTGGDALIHIDELDACVKVDEPPVDLPSAEPNEVEQRIGRYIAEMIPDGGTLQIGVGAIPNAVVAALKAHRHLGLHTEAMTDGVVELLESGVMDNSQKKVLPGISVGSLTVGSKKLYKYMHRNPELVMKDVAWTNDPFRIAQNPKVMAINSAIEVDLTGQICADSIGTMLYSGVGGQHDFMYGGSLSEGGKTFIALPSITGKGMSKIKAVLTPGAGVVTTRSQAQYVVTEYGVAELLCKNTAERARALINIAHPSAREELEKAARERFGYSFTRLK